jgi:hypothetical protein
VSGVIHVEGVIVNARIIAAYTCAAAGAENSIFIDTISAISTEFHIILLSKRVAKRLNVGI